MKDYSVQIKVRNAPLLNIMRLNGIETAAQLSRASGVSQSVIGKYLNLKEAPITPKGRLSGQVIKIAKALKVLPEDLFPPQHLEKALNKNVAEVEMSLPEIESIACAGSPDELLFDDEEIQRAMGGLTPRQAKVLKDRFGFNGESHTYREIGEKFGITGNRVQQIERDALKRFKKMLSKNREVED